MHIKENKKLVVSLFISFIVIASFTGIMGYASTSITKESINQLVGQQSTVTAFTVLNKIDVSVANNISELKKLGKESIIQNTLILSNDKSDPISENRIISDKLDEKINLENKELGYAVYENITIKNLEGKVIGFSGNQGESIFEETPLDEFREFEIVINDVYYDEMLDEYVYAIGILISDTKGQQIGSIYALINFQEIMELIDESRNESSFASSEFDLFYDDGFLLYSTTERPEEYSVSDFVLGFEEIQDDINNEFENLDEQYDEILREFGYVEPELSEKEWNALEEMLLPLDEQYGDILQEYESEELSENRAIHLEEQMLKLDLQYNQILEDYGFIVPSLSEEKQAEFDDKVFAIEGKYDEIYDKFNFDFTFGGKGFVIAESEQNEGEMLHSYSRQKGHSEFEGFDWILVVHTEMDEILQDVNSQRDTLLILTISMTITATILGIFFSRIFYRQYQKINENEKMSTIGHLSSNIAHDLRNPLGAIRSSTERIKDQNQDHNNIISDEIKRINRSVKRMSHQIEGVLNYVRTTPLITDEFSILDMLSYAKDSLDIPSNIEIDLPKNDILIECDQEKLEITFSNLLLNAVQAIGNQDGKIEITLIEGNNSVRIIFTNNGPKIPDDVLPQIFEPLFTTQLKGTGLGLSSCKNIVEQHHGKITIKQDPVTFTIQIPKKQR